jgi:hypothetical protein
VYQSIVIPFDTVALKFTVPVPQRQLLLGVVGAPGTVFTVAVAAAEVSERQVTPLAVYDACAVTDLTPAVEPLAV